MPTGLPWSDPNSDPLGDWMKWITGELAKLEHPVAPATRWQGQQAQFVIYDELPQLETNEERGRRMLQQFIHEQTRG